MTECGQCGECCQHIFWAHNEERDARYRGAPDPREDWAHWMMLGYSKEDVEYVTNHWLTVNFITEHWHPLPEDPNYSNCDVYDAERKLCGDHENSPPICKGYPWYGREPVSFRVERHLPDHCSFWEDIPKEVWPARAQPVSLSARRGLPAAQ